MAKDDPLYNIKFVHKREKVGLPYPGHKKRGHLQFFEHLKNDLFLFFKYCRTYIKKCTRYYCSQSPLPLLPSFSFSCAHLHFPADFISFSSDLLLFKYVWKFLQDVSLKLYWTNRIPSTDSTVNLFLSFVHWACNSEKTRSTLSMWGEIAKKNCNLQ